MSIEDLGELSDGMKDFNFNLRDPEGNLASEMKASFDKFRTNLPKDVSLLDGDISVNKETKHVELTKADGKVIDLNKLQTDLTTGNYSSAFDELGISKDTAASKEFLSQRDISFSETKMGQDRAAFSEMKTGGSKLPNLDDIKSEQDLENKLPDSSAKIKQANDDLKKMQDDNKNATKEEKEKATDSFLKKYGKGILKTLLGLATLAALAFAAKDLYDYIKGIRDALSGCWSQTANGKCKIAAMTCDDDDLNNPGGSDGFNLCTACTTITCPVGDWIPLLPSKAKSCDPSGKADYPGCYDYTLPSGENTCVQPFKDTCSTNTQFACANASGCISRSEACANKQNSDCSSWCSPDIAMLQSGQSIGCQNVSMADAAYAALGNLFDIPSGFLGALKKIFLIIVIVIVGIIVLYGLWKLVSWLWGKYSERNVEKEEVNMLAEKLKAGIPNPLQRNFEDSKKISTRIAAQNVKPSTPSMYSSGTNIESPRTENKYSDLDYVMPRNTNLVESSNNHEIPIPTPNLYDTNRPTIVRTSFSPDDELR